MNVLETLYHMICEALRGWKNKTTQNKISSSTIMLGVQHAANSGPVIALLSNESEKEKLLCTEKRIYLVRN